MIACVFLPLRTVEEFKKKMALLVCKAGTDELLGQQPDSFLIVIEFPRGKEPARDIAEATTRADALRAMIAEVVGNEGKVQVDFNGLTVTNTRVFVTPNGVAYSRSIMGRLTRRLPPGASRLREVAIVSPRNINIPRAVARAAARAYREVLRGEYEDRLLLTTATVRTTVAVDAPTKIEAFANLCMRPLDTPLLPYTERFIAEPGTPDALRVANVNWLPAAGMSAWLGALQSRGLPPCSPIDFTPLTAQDVRKFSTGPWPVTTRVFALDRDPELLTAVLQATMEQQQLWPDGVDRLRAQVAIRILQVQQWSSPATRSAKLTDLRHSDLSPADLPPTTLGTVFTERDARMRALEFLTVFVNRVRLIFSAEAALAAAPQQSSTSAVATTSTSTGKPGSRGCYTGDAYLDNLTPDITVFTVQVRPERASGGSERKTLELLKRAMLDTAADVQQHTQLLVRVAHDSLSVANWTGTLIVLPETDAQEASRTRLQSILQWDSEITTLDIVSMGHSDLPFVSGYALAEAYVQMPAPPPLAAGERDIDVVSLPSDVRGSIALSIVQPRAIECKIDVCVADVPVGWELQHQFVAAPGIETDVHVGGVYYLADGMRRWLMMLRNARVNAYLPTTLQVAPGGILEKFGFEGRWPIDRRRELDLTDTDARMLADATRANIELINLWPTAQERRLVAFALGVVEKQPALVGVAVDNREAVARALSFINAFLLRMLPAPSSEETEDWLGNDLRSSNKENERDSAPQWQEKTTTQSTGKDKPGEAKRRRTAETLGESSESSEGAEALPFTLTPITQAPPPPPTVPALVPVPKPRTSAEPISVEAFGTVLSEYWQALVAAGQATVPEFGSIGSVVLEEDRIKFWVKIALEIADKQGVQSALDFCELEGNVHGMQKHVCQSEFFWFGLIKLVYGYSRVIDENTFTYSPAIRRRVSEVLNLARTWQDARAVFRRLVACTHTSVSLYLPLQVDEMGIGGAPTVTRNRSDDQSWSPLSINQTGGLKFGRQLVLSIVSDRTELPSSTADTISGRLYLEFVVADALPRAALRLPLFYITNVAEPMISRYDDGVISLVPVNANGECMPRRSVSIEMLTRWPMGVPRAALDSPVVRELQTTRGIRPYKDTFVSNEPGNVPIGDGLYVPPASNEQAAIGSVRRPADTQRERNDILALRLGEPNVRFSPNGGFAYSLVEITAQITLREYFDHLRRGPQATTETLEAGDIAVVVVDLSAKLAGKAAAINPSLENADPAAPTVFLLHRFGADFPVDFGPPLVRFAFINSTYYWTSAANARAREFFGHYNSLLHVDIDLGRRRVEMIARGVFRKNLGAGRTEAIVRVIKRWYAREDPDEPMYFEGVAGTPQLLELVSGNENVLNQATLSFPKTAIGEDGLHVIPLDLSGRHQDPRTMERFEPPLKKSVRQVNTRMLAPDYKEKLSLGATMRIQYGADYAERTFVITQEINLPGAGRPFGLTSSNAALQYLGTLDMQIHDIILNTVVGLSRPANADYGESLVESHSQFLLQFVDPRAVAERKARFSILPLRISHLPESVVRRVILNTDLSLFSIYRHLE